MEYSSNINKDIFDLPSESIYSILSYLKEKELTTVSCVSKYFKELADNNFLWNEFLLERNIEKSQNRNEAKTNVINKVNKYILTIGPLVQKLKVREFVENFHLYLNATNSQAEDKTIEDLNIGMLTENNFKNCDVRKKYELLSHMIPKNIFEAETFLEHLIKDYTDRLKPHERINLFNAEILVAENLNDPERVRILLEAGALPDNGTIYLAGEQGAPANVLEMLEKTIW